MTRKKKIIFVHGYGLGVPLEAGDWPRTLAHDLEKYGFDFKILLMPDPVYPEVSEWLNFIKKQEIKVDLDTYFIGHSLGCITIARFLETLPVGKVAGGCVLVSGFCSLPQIPLLADFCNLPLDYNEVKKHAREFVMVASLDDHLIPLSASEELGQRLDARMVVDSNKLGHFVTGVREIPSLLNIVLEMDQMRKEIVEMKSLKQKS